MKVTCSEQADMDFTRFASGRRKCDVVVGFDIFAKVKNADRLNDEHFNSNGKQNLNQ